MVAALRSRGFEYLCHLPMEAKGDANPGPGAARTVHGPRRAAPRPRCGHSAPFPGAAGANNHMGSAVMSARRATSEVLGLLAGRGLFFVDSRTSRRHPRLLPGPRPRACRPAERQVFLDASGDAGAIREQWNRLLGEAKSRGAALAIAHPHDTTLAVLAEAIPAARQDGFEFVKASELVER